MQIITSYSEEHKARRKRLGYVETRPVVYIIPKEEVIEKKDNVEKIAFAGREVSAREIQQKRLNVVNRAKNKPAKYYNLTPDELIFGSKNIHPSLIQIRDAVAVTFDVPLDTLLGTGQDAPTCLVRHAGMYLCRVLTKASLTQISRVWMKKDHSTVINAVDRTQEWMAVDSEFEQKVNEIKYRLIGSRPSHTFWGS